MGKHQEGAPRLRFPEFGDEWQNIRLGNVFERVTRKNTENNQNILTISAQDGLVSQEKFFSKLVAAKDVTNYYLLHKNDYAYNKSYSKGYPMGAIKRLVNDDKGVVSTLYICFTSTKGNELFFDQYFESGRLNSELEKIAQEGARNHGLLNMNMGDFFNTRLVIPSAPEQQKIASFLTTVDQRITKHQQRLSLLKDYKKGVMQKIFSQQVRFKDENGKDHPDWRDKKLGDVTTLFSTRNKNLGGAPVYSVTNKAGFVLQTSHFNKVVAGEDLSSYKIIKKDDFAYNPARINVGSIARFKEDIGTISSLYVCFRSTKDLNATFLEHFLELDKTRFYFNTFGEGGVRIYLWYPLFALIKIHLPQLSEQQKIASLLSVIDEKIKTEETKLMDAKKYKKALLQKMFV